MPRCRQNISAKALAFGIIPPTVCMWSYQTEGFHHIIQPCYQVSTFENKGFSTDPMQSHLTTTGHKQAKTLIPFPTSESLNTMIFFTLSKFVNCLLWIQHHTIWCLCKSHQLQHQTLTISHPDLSGCPVTRLVRSSPMNSARCSSGLAEVTGVSPKSPGIAQRDCRWFVLISSFLWT